MNNIKNILLIIKSHSPNKYGLAYSYCRAFNKLGFRVTFAELQPSISLNLLNRLLFNNYVNKNITSIFTKNLFLYKTIKFIKSYNPDISIIFNTYDLSFELYKAIKKYSRYTAIIFSDSPLYYRKFDDKEFFKLLNDIDLVFSFAKELIPVFYQLGAKKVAWLPFASDIEANKPSKIDSEKERVLISDLNHIGNYELPKGYFIQSIYKKVNNIDIKIFGYNWQRYPYYSEIKSLIYPIEIGPNFGKVCQNSKISLNFVRASHGCFHNMKTFEIPSSGGFMITNRTDEQLYFFEEDKEAVYFNTADELIDKINYYLKNESVREKIRLKGYEKAKKMSYLDRVTYLLKSIKAL